MNIISDILYWISTGLLVPDIVLLIVLFGRALLLVGSFYGQYLSIRKTEALLRNELNALTPDTFGNGQAEGKIIIISHIVHTPGAPGT